MAEEKERVVSAFYTNNSFDDFQSKHIVKVVMDNHFQALYFSRSQLPFQTVDQFKGFSQHVGIYGYWRETLERFMGLPPSTLEGVEKLEQLRFLSNGIKIKLIESNQPTVGVDLPEDVEEVQRILRVENEKN